MYEIRENTFGVSDRVRHKLGCAKTSHLANQQLICALVNVVQIISKPDKQRSFAIFNGCEYSNFQMKKKGIFLFFAQNIDRVYTLAPPR